MAIQVPLVALQTIIDLEPGTIPNFNYMQSVARHVKENAASIAEVGGGTIGFGSPLDLRYYAEDVGVADAVEIVPQQEPETGDTLTAGMFYFVRIAATNGGPATLEVRNTADDVNLISPIKDEDGNALGGGELVANDLVKFLYLTDGGSLDEWRIVSSGNVIIANDLFNYRGAWSAGTFNAYDVVTNNGETWVALTTTTDEPTGASSDWDKLAAKGADGADGDMINPMTAAGDMIVGGAFGAPGRLAKGTTGRHMRAGASGPEYGGDVDMDGDVLSGQNGKTVTISGASNLNNTTHRGVILRVQNVTLTIVANATTAYETEQFSVVSSTHASGGTLTAVAGVTLNGVDGGSATIKQYEAYALHRVGADDWVLYNASVS